MRRIKGARSALALHFVCMECGDKFNTTHVSAALVHLASMPDPAQHSHSWDKTDMQPEPNTGQVTSTTSATSAPWGDKHSEGSSGHTQPTHNLSTGEPPPFFVGRTDSQLRQDVLLLLLLQLRGQGASSIENLDACGLAHVVLALGRLRHQDSELLRRLLSASTQRMGQFTEPQLGALITGLARLGYRPGCAWRTAFYAACFKKLPQKQPQPAKHLQQSPGSAQQDQTLQPASTASQSVAVILWALARLECRPPVEWLSAMLWQGMPEATLLGMKPQELSGVAYALGRLGFRPADTWCSALLHAAAQRMAHSLDGSSWTVQDIAGFMWGIARLHCVPSSEWLVAALRVAKEQLHMANPSHLTMLINAVAMLYTQCHKVQRASSASTAAAGTAVSRDPVSQPHTQQHAARCAAPASSAAAGASKAALSGSPSPAVASEQPGSTEQVPPAAGPSISDHLQMFVEQCLAQVCMDCCVGVC